MYMKQEKKKNFNHFYFILKANKKLIFQANQSSSSQKQGIIDLSKPIEIKHVMLTESPMLFI